MRKVRLVAVILLIACLCGCSNLSKATQQELIDCVSGKVDEIKDDYLIPDYTVAVAQRDTYGNKKVDSKIYYVSIDVPGYTEFKSKFHVAHFLEVIKLFDTDMYRALGVDIPEDITIMTQVFDGDTQLYLMENQDGTLSLVHNRSENDFDFVFSHLTWDEINDPVTWLELYSAESE